MFFSGTKVENANFTQVNLGAAETQYTLKARVSAPFGLNEIKVYSIVNSSESLINTITEFGNSPNENFVYQQITGITSAMDVRFEASDKDGRKTIKVFKITKNP